MSHQRVLSGLFSALFLVTGTAAHAVGPTYITGGNVGSTTWVAADSPYIIQGDATVQAGATLVIQAGVEVRFATNDGQAGGFDATDVELIIAGTLDAQGTTNDPIVFRADSGTAAGTWYGLVFTNTATNVVLSNATIAHAQHGIRTDAPTATITSVAIDTVTTSGIYGEGGNPVVDGLTVRGSQYGVQLVNDGGITLSNCLLHNNSSYGVYATNTTDIGTATFDHCTLDGNTYGFYANNNSASDYAITNSIVTNNTSFGIREFGTNTVTASYTNIWNNASPTSGVTVSNNTAANPLYVATGTDYTLTSNSPSRFGGNDGLDAGPDFLAYSGDATPGLYGTLWVDTTLPAGVHSLAGDLTVAPSVTLTIDPGATLRWTANSDIMGAYSETAKGELRIAGTLLSAGQPGSEILFDSTGSTANSWLGVHFLTTATGSVLSDAIVSEAGYGIWYSATADNVVDTVFIDKSSGAGAYVDAGTPTLNRLSVTTSVIGVYYDLSGGGTLTNSLIYGNSSHGVFAGNTTDVGLVTIDHCTLDGNSYGFYSNNNSSSDYAITNSIVTNNTSYGLREFGSNTVTASYTNIWNNPTPSSGVTVSNNTSANPLYLSTGSDYTLTSRSPSRFYGSDGFDGGPDFLAYLADATPGLYGTLWVNTTLPAGVHALAGDLTVAPGITLTIDPGATLRWTANSDIMGAYADTTKGELRVGGTLWSLGQIGNEVLFDSTGSTASSWYGIHYLSTANGGLFNDAIIQEAVYGIRYSATTNNPVTRAYIDKSGSSGVLVDAGAPTLSGITAVNGVYGVEYQLSGGGLLQDCLVANNSSYGIYATNTTDVGVITIDHCTLDRNTYGFYANNNSSSDYLIRNSNITNNTSYGVREFGTNTTTASYSNIWNNPTPTSGVTVSNNTSANPIYLTAGSNYTLTSNSPSRYFGSDGLDLGPGALAYGTDPTPGLYGTLWEDLELTPAVYAVPGDLTVAPGTTLTVRPGVTLNFANNADIMGAYTDVAKGEFRVAGTVYFLGTPVNPIVMQSTGNVDGGWSGVNFLPSALGSIFQYVAIDEAVVGVRYAAAANNPIEFAVITDSSDSGILVEAGAPLIDGVRITDGTIGIHLASSGGGTVQNTVIHGNSSYGVYAVNTTDIGVATFTNCTFNANTYGFYSNNNSSSDYDVRNSSITNNTSYGMREFGSNTLTASYCNIWNNPTATSGVTVSNNLAVNPLYVGASDFHLQPSSPNVDAGNPTNAPDHDINDTPRPVDGDGLNGAEYDIGAFEYANQVPGITLTPPGTQTTTELGIQAQFTVVLDSAPIGGVSLAISSSDLTEGTVLPASLAFDAADWNIPKQVTVTGVNDDIDDGDRAYQINLDPSGSTDLTYQTVGTKVHPMINTNDDFTSVLAVPASGLVTTEGGGTAQFTVVLGAEPTSDVRIDVTSSDATEASVFPPVLTFNAGNWDTPVQVTATGLDDALLDGNIAYQVRLNPALSGDAAYAALAIVNVGAVNNDDDTVSAGITVNKATLTTTEAGGTDTFTVVLDSVPTGNVTIPVAVTDLTEGSASVGLLTFQIGTWNIPQQVQVAGVNDSVDDGDVQYPVTLGPVGGADAAYSALVIPNITVTNTDDDTVGVLVSRATVTTTEGGSSETFTLRLASEPVSSVTVAVASSDTNEATVDRASVVFGAGDWMNPVLISITPVDDAVEDGDQPYTITIGPVTSSDPLYAAIDPADIAGTNVDDDGVGVLVSRSTVTTAEGGADETFTIVLTSAPTANVNIALASSDLTEATVDQASLLFTAANWMTPRVVTISPVDDDVDDGDRPYLISVGPITSADTDYAAIDPADVDGTHTDDDTAGVRTDIAGVLATGEDGTADSFDVWLDSEPTSNVTIELSSSNLLEGTIAPATLVFTAADWDVPQTATLTGVDDGVVDGAIGYQAVVGVNSADSVYNAIADDTFPALNQDDDGAGIFVDPTSGLVTTEAGGTASFDVVLLAQPTADVVIDVASDTPTEGVASPAQLVFTNANWDTAQTVVVTGVDDGFVDGSTPYTVELAAAVSADPAFSGVDPDDVDLVNTDDDQGGAIVAPTNGLVTTEGGGTDSFDVVLSGQPGANVIVVVSSDNPQEGSVSAPLLTFTPVNWSTAQTVTVTGVDDDVADGDVVFTVSMSTSSGDLAWDGLVVDEVEVTNEDDDAAGIYVSPTSGLATDEGGASASFTVELISEPTADVTLTVASSDPSEGAVTPVQIVFDAGNWDIPVTVLVTGVDDADVDGDVGFTVETDPAASADPNYDGLDAQDVAVVNLDDDVATTGDTGTATGTPTGTATGGPTDTGPLGADKGSGCSCDSSGTSVGWLWLVGLLGLGARRRGPTGR